MLRLTQRRWIALIVIGLLAVSAMAPAPSFASSSFQSEAMQDKGDPTKEPAVEEPTKAPPPDEHTQPEKTATPAQGLEPIKTPTPLLAPTKPALSGVEGTPTFGPTSTAMTASTEAVEPSGEPTHVPQSTPTPTITDTPVMLHVIGVVFDDADGDGQRDADESGLPGVPVIVESNGEQTTIVTDAGGTYTAHAAPVAIVKVVPPAGWRTPGLAALPAPEAGDFPLRRMESATHNSAAPVTITQSALDLTGIAIGFAVLGVLVWVGLLAHQRTTTRSFQQWALADLRLRHEAERESRQFTVKSDDEALTVLEQAALDATGARPFITHLVRDRSRLSPVAAIVAFSAADARHWIFSPASPDQLKRLGREPLTALFGKDGRRGTAAAFPFRRRRAAVETHHAINALNSSPFVTDNLAAVLRHLTADSSSPLPRAEQWQVYVVDSSQKKSNGRLVM